MQTAARLLLGLTLILTPFRLRLTLQHRPVPPVYGDFTDLLLFGSEILLLLTLVLWWAGWRIRPRRYLSFGPPFLTLPLLGLTAAAALSTAYSLDPVLSGFNSIKLVLLFGYYLLLVNERGPWPLLIAAVLIQGYVQSTAGIGQVLAQSSLGLTGLGELELDPTWNGVSIVWAEGRLSLRAYGLTDHPNILGGCLAFGSLLTAGALFRVGNRWRPVMAVVWTFNLVGLLLTFSRSAWLALVAGGLLLLALSIRHARRPVSQALILLGLSAGLLTAPFLIHNWPFIGVRANVISPDIESDIERRSINERLALNRAANEIFTRQPLTGTGLSTFPQALRESRPGLGFDYQPAHLVLLDVAAETGLFGALFYALLFLSPWVALLLKRRSGNLPLELIAATAALTGLSIISLLDYYPWHLVPGRLWAWTIWGVWAQAYQNGQRSDGID